MHFDRRSQRTAGRSGAEAAAHMTRVHVEMMMVHDERRLDESSAVIVQRQLMRHRAAQLRHHHRRFMHNRGTVFGLLNTRKNTQWGKMAPRAEWSGGYNPSVMLRAGNPDARNIRQAAIRDATIYCALWWNRDWGLVVIHTDRSLR